MSYQPTAEEANAAVKWVPGVDDWPSLEFNIYLDSTGFEAGHSGWRLSPYGDAEFQNVVIRGAIQSMGIQRRAASVAGGKLMVSAGSILTRDLGAGDTVIYVRDYCFEPDDIVRLYTDPYHDEYLRITSKHTVLTVSDADKVIGEFSYTVQRNIGSGLGVPCAFEKGDVVAVWVRSDTGGILIDADDAQAPFIDILERTGTNPDDVLTRVRVGRLDGIDDPLFDPFGGISGQGLYGDNVILKGKFIITSDSTGPFGIGGYDSTGWQNLWSDATAWHAWGYGGGTTYIDGGVIYTNTIVVGHLDFDATSWQDWQHPDDITLIDGGSIYTNTITADKINVDTLSAITADMGTLTAGEIRVQSGSAEIHLDAANRRIDIRDENGILRVRLGDLS